MRITYLPVPALIGLSLMTSSLFAQEAPAAIDPKAKGLIDETAAFYRGLDTFQVLTKLSIGISGPGIESEPDQLSQLISVKRPDQFSLVTKEQSQYMGSIDAYLKDGKGTLKLDQEGVIKTKGIETIEGFLTHPDLGYEESVGGNMLFDQNLAFALFKEIVFDIPGDSWDKNLTKLAFVGEEEKDGKKVNHLSLTVKSGLAEDEKELDMDLWLDSGDEPHFVHLKPDMTKFFEEMNPEAQGMTMEMEGSWSDWRVGDEVADGAFDAPDMGDLQTHDSFKAMMVSLQEEQAKRAEQANPAAGLVGEKAEDFTLDLLNGEKFTLSEQAGEKVVILDFWATWCGPCIAALPELIAAAEDFKDRDVILVAVNLREESTEIRKFLADEKMKFTVALDTDGKVGELFQVQAIPQTVIIGKDGIIKKVHIGSAPGLKDRISAELEEILGE